MQPNSGRRVLTITLLGIAGALVLGTSGALAATPYPTIVAMGSEMQPVLAWQGFHHGHHHRHRWHGQGRGGNTGGGSTGSSSAGGGTGSSSTGGASTGSSSTGGASTGSSSTGGGSTGSSSTGGASTGSSSTGGGSTTGGSSGGGTATSLTSQDQQVLTLINEARAAGGLGALEVNATLQSLALEKADDMIKYDYFSDTSPDLGTPLQMEEAAGYEAQSMGGEDVAEAGSVSAAWALFEGSPPHWENIMYPYYTQVGIAVAQNGSSVIVEILFSGNPD